jgi:hypothetical protein
MDHAKVMVLAAIAYFNDLGHTWVKATHGDTLDALDGGRIATTAWRAAEHAARLKWFGLLDYKGHRTGAYKVTDKGRLFLAGRLSVPATIWCQQGTVVESSSDQVSISDVKDVILDRNYWNRYATQQKAK